jgi:hypothetical protein
MEIADWEFYFDTLYQINPKFADYLEKNLAGFSYKKTSGFIEKTCILTENFNSTFCALHFSAASVLVRQARGVQECINKCTNDHTSPFEISLLVLCNNRCVKRGRKTDEKEDFSIFSSASAQPINPGQFTIFVHISTLRNTQLKIVCASFFSSSQCKQGSPRLIHVRNCVRSLFRSSKRSTAMHQEVRGG